MMRAWLVLLTCASALQADVDALLRRGETRLAHGNVDGARTMFERATEEEPTCAPALERLASTDEKGGAGSRLRYLLDARSLDPTAAARFLLELRDRVVDFPEETYVEAERATMGPDSPIVGVWPPWDRPAPLSAWLMVNGPLRGEAFGTPSHAHRDALRRVAERFVREGFRPPVAWARLAVLLRLVGDDKAADAALARAEPSTLADRLDVAECVLVASHDSAAWWRARGERLILDASEAGGERALPATEQVCKRARELLAREKDLQALVALARIEGACAAPDRQVEVLQRTTEAITSEWLPEEALHALEGSEDVATSCVRAHLLFVMLQDDLGLATLEQAVERAPDSLLALGALAYCLQREGYHTAQERISHRLEQAAKKAGKVPSAQPLAASDEAKAVSASIASCIRSGESKSLPALIDTLSPDSAATAGDLYDGMKDALAAFAAIPRWSRSQERFVRAACRGRDISESYPFARFRVWQEVSAVPAFRTLPSGPYVLSLLLDARTQTEEAFALRKAAVEAGCRCTGLLVDLARDGQPVPEVLAQADPVAARLEAALAGDDAALERFLEEDEAWPEQILAAREELCRRRGLPMPAPPDDPVLAMWDTPLERLSSMLREGKQEMPAGWVERRLAEVIADPYPGATSEAFRLEQTLASPIASTLAGGRWWEGKPAWGSPRPAPIAAVASAEDLAHRSPSDPGWLEEATKVIADHGHEALVTILEGPRGSELIQRRRDLRVASGAEMLAAIREVGARHPLDLRWVEAEGGPWAPNYSYWQGDWDLEEKLLRSRQRNASELLKHLSNSRGKGKRAGLIDKYVALLREDAPAHVVEHMFGLDSAVDLQGELRAALVALLARAQGEEELWSIASRARDWHMQDLADRADARLLEAGCGWQFVQVYESARKRGAASKDPAVARELALGKLAGQGDVAWVWVAEDAVASEKVDLLIEALEAIWQKTPASLDPNSDRNRSGSDSGLAALAKSGACLDLLKQRLKKGDVPLSTWAFADASLSWCFTEWVRDLRPLDHLHAAGLPLGVYDLVGSGRIAPGGFPTYLRRKLRIDRERGAGDKPLYFVKCICDTLDWAHRTEEIPACRRAYAEWEGAWMAGPDSRWGLQQALPFPWVDTRVDLGIPLEDCALPIELHEASLFSSVDEHEQVMALLEKAAQRATDPVVRCAILAGVGEIAHEYKHDERAVPALLRVLQESPIPAERLRAHKLLSEEYARSGKAHPLFVEALLARCASMPAPDAESVRAWEGRLSIEDAALREQATEELLTLGLGAVPIARALLATRDAEVRGRAGEVLDRLAEP